MLVQQYRATAGHRPARPDSVSRFLTARDGAAIGRVCFFVSLTRKVCSARTKQCHGHLPRDDRARCGESKRARREQENRYDYFDEGDTGALISHGAQ
jgi:hypothetical protein